MIMMLRRLLIGFGLLVVLLGADSLPADGPVFDGKEIARAHEEGQKTGICEIHKIKMIEEPVPIRWGVAVPPAPGDPSYQYTMQHFPNYIKVIEGGCVKIPGRTSKLTLICSRCKAEALAWKSAKK
jgi:hypothetical protein